MRIAPWLVVLCLLAACATSESDSLEWGVGAKADDVCDRDGALCWGPADLDAVHAITAARVAVDLGDLSEVEGAAAVAASLRQLSHKLSPDELDELDAIDRADGETWERAAALAVRLEAAQLTAHSVQLGRALEFAVDKGDDAASDDDGDELDPGLGAAERSLENLKRTNIAGRVFGTMIGASGAHREFYRVTDRDSFVASGPSREEQVDDIIESKARWAGLVGVGGGAINLIPGAGIFLSIPLETVALFNLHARMSFSVAAAYGWDIHSGDNLEIVALALLTDGELDALDDELAGLPRLPALLRAIGRELGLPVTSTLAVRLTATAIAWAVKILARRAATLLGKAAALEVGEKALGQVLGWASLGLSVLAAGAADWYITRKVGAHVALLTRPWLIDLPIEGTRYLSTPSRRQCYVNALGAIAHADGAVHASEQNMIDTLIDKPYYVGDGVWIELSSAERADLRARFAAPTASHGCLSNLEGETPRRKLIMLSHFFGMASIDLSRSGSEQSLVDDFVDDLDGSGFFDGPEVDELHIRFVDGAVRRAIDSEYDLLDW